MSFVVISADILILFYLNRFKWDFAAALIVVISLFFLLIMLIANVIATLNDDFLSENTLAEMAQNIEKNPQKWIVTERVYKNGNSITKAKDGEGKYNYVKDFLL